MSTVGDVVDDVVAQQSAGRAADSRADQGDLAAVLERPACRSAPAPYCSTMGFSVKPIAW